ncbi:MAG: 5-(carboxyamino)imidazole ribonucleotide synthase [Alphaproteobacteria bacterium]|nr:5-(carboxyamino)imidazole ribonucleotide synthase [Alphaproteobacteria bacterium]
MILPGATIGIIGGGQLGRMTALAAARLGYRSHIFSPDADSPAKQVTPYATTAAYDDHAALKRFASAIDIATYEFENVPLDTAKALGALKPLRPGAGALEIAQDRLKEKYFLRGVGVGTTAFRPVESAEQLARALAEIGPRGVLKTVRLGYDGKGQVMLGPETDAAAAWNKLGASVAVLEGFVDFACELSSIVARGEKGEIAAYPVVENRHVNHILDTTVAPAEIPVAVAAEAERIACHVAERLDLVGLLAVEMFLTKSGELLVNELAPRPHNSGHWTIDACMTSQFEQLVRAICGLPLGSTERHSNAVMKNLIGDQVETWRDVLTDPAAHLHLYGKGKPSPGRKMGHVTRLLPKR